MDPVSGASRAVLLLGATIGTALVVLALWQGARPQLPGMPAFLGLAAGVLLMWLIVMALATVAAHLVRLHHRDVTALARRHGKRAALAGPGAQDVVTGPCASGRPDGRARAGRAARRPGRCGGTGRRRGSRRPEALMAPDPRVNAAQQASDAAARGISAPPAVIPARRMTRWSSPAARLPDPRLAHRRPARRVLRPGRYRATGRRARACRHRKERRFTSDDCRSSAGA